MKKITGAIGAVVVAVLLVIAAGCTTSSAGRNTAIPTPAGPAGTTVMATATGALPEATPFVTPPAAGGPGSQQEAAIGDTVSVFYTGTFENGTVFDSNMDSATPIVFTLGNSSVIQGFDDALVGMSVNQVKTVNIPAEKAYGVYNTSLIRTVNRTGPLENASFVEGQSYTIHDRTTNSVSVVKILKVTPTNVTWDANDPLAGLNFTFTIKLAGITRP